MKTSVSFCIVIVLTQLNDLLCNYCSEDICKKCCQVTTKGCINNQLYLQGKMISFLSFCEDCDCNDDNNGCGWKAIEYGMIECASCDSIKSDNLSTENVSTAGCGKLSISGEVMFTQLPNPFN